ncbi:hypothetical protein B0H11DRAFT_2223472 [Mycena galericulata]|nr:hypothetical protein B0H11DRAFT_2223472 [Mycena galericulata]
MSSSTTASTQPSARVKAILEDYWIYLRLIRETDLLLIVQLFQLPHLKWVVRNHPQQIPALLERVKDDFHAHTLSRLEHSTQAPYQGNYFMAGMRRIYDADPRHSILVPDFASHLDFDLPEYKNLSDRLHDFQFPPLGEPKQLVDPFRYDGADSDLEAPANLFIPGSSDDDSDESESEEESSGAEVAGFGQPRDDSDSSGSESDDSSQAPAKRHTVSRSSNEPDAPVPKVGAKRKPSSEVPGSSSESDTPAPKVGAKRKPSLEVPRASKPPAVKKAKGSGKSSATITPAAPAPTTTAKPAKPAPSKPKGVKKAKKSPPRLTAEEKGKSKASSKAAPKKTRARKNKDETPLNAVAPADLLLHNPTDLVLYARNEHSEMARLGVRGTPLISYSDTMLETSVSKARALAISRVSRWFEDPRFPKTGCISCVASLKTCVPQGTPRRFAIDTAFFNKITGGNTDVISSMVEDFEAAATNQQQLSEAAFKAEVETLYRLRKLLYYLVSTLGEVAPNDAEYHDEAAIRTHQRLVKMANHLSIQVGTPVRRDDDFKMPEEPLFLPNEVAPVSEADFEGLLQVEPASDPAPVQPEAGPSKPTSELVKQEPTVATIPTVPVEVIDLLESTCCFTTYEHWTSIFVRILARMCVSPNSTGKSVDLAHLLFLHKELVPFYFKDRSFPSFGILDKVALTRELALYSFKEKYDLFWHARHVGANSVFVATLAKSLMASTP